MLLLLVLWRTIKDHDTLFVLAEMAHFIGIGVLGYKLHKKKSVAGKPTPASAPLATKNNDHRMCRFVAADAAADCDLLGSEALLQVGCVTGPQCEMRWWREWA